MNRTQLVAAFREAANDTRLPYLWGNGDVQRYLDDAHNEAAERTLALRDSTTQEICEVAVQAGVATLELDERILEVLRAKLDSGERPLGLTTLEAIDLDWPAWQDEEADEPCKLVLDREGAAWKARLVPPPAADTTLRLDVHRLPLGSITDQEPPELRERLHVKLIDWMLFLAYSRPDADTQDTRKADEHATIFAATFGPKRDLHTMRVDHDRLFPYVRSADL